MAAGSWQTADCLDSMGWPIFAGVETWRDLHELRVCEGVRESGVSERGAIRASQRRK